MRVVLCQAFSRTIEKESDFEPLGLAYLSSYVTTHAPGIEVLYAESVDEALSLSPELVGISSVSQNMDIAKGFARELRERGYEGPLVLGGVHISELPSGLYGDLVEPTSRCTFLLSKTRLGPRLHPGDVACHVPGAPPVGQADET